MKTKFLLFTLLLLFISNARADYVPMLQVGKTWEIHGATCDMFSYTTSSFKNFISIIKDTTIDGKQYYVFNDGTCMREDIQKQEVYLFDKKNSQDNLFYKFDVNTGDTLNNLYGLLPDVDPLCKNVYYVVDSVSLLNSHKLIYLSAIPLCSESEYYYRNDESFKEIWLEGVGNINKGLYNSPYYRPYWDLGRTGICYHAMLMSVYIQMKSFFIILKIHLYIR